MEFRWIALVTLWTLLSGPVLAVPTSSAARTSGTRVVELKAKPAAGVAR